MLAIPVMKADVSADLTHLGMYLRNQHSYPEQQLTADLLKLETLRREAINVTEASDYGQQQIVRYCTQLKAIIPRLSSMQAELKISFSWYDAFTTSKKNTSNLFQFDLACCLWNLASFESLLGGRVDRSTDEGIRTANKHFQQAAGYFQYIIDLVLPYLTNMTTPSLSADSLLLCKQLMLAQAQLCFYEKAVKDKKKDSMKSVVIAKLAAQASLFYGQSASTSRSGALAQVLDISWFAVSDFQCKCFKGAAEYWAALASKEAALQRGSGYGEEIVRYGRAEGHVRQAVETSKKYNLPAGLVGGADGLLSAIQSNRTGAQHDLNTVYLESLPADSSLADVQPVAMVKPSTVDLSVADGLEIFKYVLPRAIMESNKNFYDEVTTYHTRTATEAENATNFGRSALSSLGLPGSLEVVKSDQPLPDTLWAKVQKVQSMGGAERLTSVLADLQAASAKAHGKMMEIDDSLASEERTNADFQRRYPGIGLMVDASAAGEIKNNLNKLRDAFRGAQANDEKIVKELADPSVKEELMVLCKSKEQLQMLFHTATMQQNSANLLDMEEADFKPRASPEATRLEEKLHLLVELFEDRTKAIEQMKALTKVDLLDYVLKALESGGDVYANHIKYSTEAKGLMQHVNEGIARQQSLLDEITQLNEQFVKSKLNDPAALARNKVIQGLEQSVARYFALHSQISSGLTFYSNLRAKLTTLQQNCDDLAYTQQWQRQEFEENQVQSKAQAQVQVQEAADRALALKLANEHQAPPPQQAYNAPGAAVYPGNTGGAYMSNYSAVQYPGQPTQPTVVPAPVYAPAPAAAAYPPPPQQQYMFAPPPAHAVAAPAPVPVHTPAPAPVYGGYPGSNPAYNPSSTPYNPSMHAPAPAPGVGGYQYNSASYAVQPPPAMVSAAPASNVSMDQKVTSPHHIAIPTC